MNLFRQTCLLVLLLVCARVTAHAQGIDLIGTTGWQKQNGALRVNAERVSNNRDRGVSGYLRLQIWAVAEEYDGTNNLTGYVLGTVNLGQLAAGTSFININRLVTYFKPPPGLYYTLITLEENTDLGYVVDDFANFPGQVNFGKYGQGTTLGGGDNDSLNFTGLVSWTASGGNVLLYGEKIANDSASGRSGQLRLRLWATSTPYDGGSILQGYPMATKGIGKLNAGYFFPNLSKKTSFRAPPAGTYYTTMTLEESYNGQWYIADFVTFPRTSLF